jgi:lipopolysaccharide export LptBFGC system permease protein LptF
VAAASASKGREHGKYFQSFYSKMFDPVLVSALSLLGICVAWLQSAVFSFPSLSCC